jgi:tetratricopeptide (TPR) repeat protein
MASLKTKAAYRVGAWLVKGELQMAGRRLRKPKKWARAKLETARKLLEFVLADIPGSWHSLWIAGKIHERLGEDAVALECFKRGLEINHSQPDLAIEAALSAVRVGKGSEAEVYARIAVAARPNDAGHKADLALALLISGKPQDAQLALAEALKLLPDDNVTKTLNRLVAIIIDNDLDCPKDMAGLQALAKSYGVKNEQQTASSTQ